jgi:hypothetical protein
MSASHLPPDLQRTQAPATGSAAPPAAPHDLAGVLGACRAARDAIAAVAAVQLAGVALLALATRAAGALLIAATAVQLALLLRFAVLAGTRTDLVRRLIVEGRSPSECPALAREWRRLADPRRRARLARSLLELADMAQRPSSYLAGARPYFNVRVVRAVAPELRELGVLLRGGDCGVRGVALLQSLQTSGASVLYGNATRPLREELARARYLLLDG